MEFLVDLLEGIKNTSMLEWIAVFSALIYLLLLTFNSIWCWLFAFLTSSIYTYICLEANLFLESILQIFYVLMAVWGWLAWGKRKAERPIKKWEFKCHLINLILSSIAVFALGYYFKNNTAQSYPYLDATTTVFSLTTTFLVVYRILSNWIYWIIIDSLGMILFYLKGFELTTTLYLLYTLMAIWGYLKWNKAYKLQSG